MVLNGTNSRAKILGVLVRKSTAYITLLIHSDIPEPTPKVLNFYLREKDNEIKISPNNYWLDYRNNTDSSFNNVDIGMHKEIILEVDITNQGRAPMRGPRWVRDCQLVIRDMTDVAKTVWVSEYLTLVSDEIELPRMTSINVFNRDDFEKLVVQARFQYDSQQDFNYSNQNLYTAISIRSSITQRVLETAILYETQMYSGQVEYVFDAREPIVTRMYYDTVQWAYANEVNMSMPAGSSYEVWKHLAVLSDLGIENISTFEIRTDSERIEYRENSEAEWQTLTLLTDLRKHTRKEYNNYIIVDVEIKNLRGQTLIKQSKDYRPFNRRFHTFIKVNGQPQRVGAIYVK